MSLFRKKGAFILHFVIIQGENFMIITMRQDATREDLRKVVLHYLGSSSRVNVMVGSPNGDGKYRVALNGLNLVQTKEPSELLGVESWTQDREFLDSHYYLFKDAYRFYPDFGY